MSPSCALRALIVIHKVLFYIDFGGMVTIEKAEIIKYTHGK